MCCYHFVVIKEIKLTFFPHSLGRVNWSVEAVLVLRICNAHCPIVCTIDIWKPSCDVWGTQPTHAGHPLWGAMVFVLHGFREFYDCSVCLYANAYMHTCCVHVRSPKSTQRRGPNCLISEATHTYCTHSSPLYKWLHVYPLCTTMWSLNHTWMAQWLCMQMHKCTRCPKKKVTNMQLAVRGSCMTLHECEVRMDERG